MKTIDQLEFGENGGIGDCWRANLASILELIPSQVPHFKRLYGPYEMKDEAAGWLYRNYGLSLVTVEVDNIYRVMPATIAIGTGKSPRDPNELHSVVVSIDQPQDCEVQVSVLHDPHPSRRGLAGPVTKVDFLVRAY